MKTCLALLLILLPIATSYAKDNDERSEHHHEARPSNSAKTLADQVGDITRSSTLTLKEKDDRVSAAVRNAITDAVAKLTDPDDILKATLDLTTAAAKAAPQFTHAILEGISNIPAVTALGGEINRIKDAVVDAATEAAAAAFDSDHRHHDRDRDHEHEDHDHDKDDHVVSPSE